MIIKEHQLYFLNDNHFEKHKNYKLFTDHDNKDKGERPYYLCIKKSEVCWVIPLSSRIDKYKEYYKKEIEKYGKSTKYHFIKMNGKESVLLIQNAFPISYSNIKKEYTTQGKPMKLENSKDVSEINSKFRNMIKLISNGHTFFPHQPNVIALEKEIVNDVKFEKYVEQLKNENNNLKSPLLLDEPVLNLIKEYNNQFKTPRTLKQLCNDYKLDKLNDIKNPIIQSIGIYFATQQENVQALDIANTTKKEIAVTKDLGIEP